MRLDKFLKVSRVIKRRTVANEISEKGRILVNGQVAKPSKQLKVGDIIEIIGANSSTKLQILIIPVGNVPAQMAETLYSLVE
ncbi:RNA-binding S4 domain-containing protein [bacterium]|nr:RNA-binding S4 domain-containing protein [bacterium]